jgi:bacterioferritin (cytochrome b1)
MALATLFVIVFLTVIVWRLVFTSLHRSSVRETAAPEQQHNNILEQGLHILGRAGVAVIAGNHFENGSDRGNSNAGEQRAETYLRRIVALTGATQMGSSYVLNVGNARFHVRDRNVKRIPEGADPTWARWETCFHPAHQDMAEAEQIATVLLQLKNNPRVFDSWASKHELAFKADGQMFNRPQ